MKLRVWQQECINAAVDKYLLGGKHFLALATPGAGKTHMSSALAERLMGQDMVDLVICFAPSTIVASDFEESLSVKLSARFDGLLGSLGLVSTYQNLLYVEESFWQLFKELRIFVIFDEIHHCSGSSVKNANAWGEKVIENIKEQAAYTISLTGTPWRSDKTPIALSNYCSKTNKVICDYSYGLKESIKDNVCRMPEIIAIENDNISVTCDEEDFSFTSFLDLFSKAILPYQDIIENEDVIFQLVQRANNRLQSIRKVNHDAGGLIVAYSVAHAEKIQRILYKKLNIEAVVVTYREDDPNQIIRNFRDNSDEWIISVGMISEGTNIPRLQVCCHLTNIKTEMHFRQILGRILRFTSSTDQSASIYIPAEPKLLEYAYRVGQDVPSEADIVKFEKVSKHYKIKKKKLEALNTLEYEETNEVIDTTKATLATSVLEFDDQSFFDIEQHSKNPLTTAYETTVNIFGRFKQESLAIGLLNELEMHQ